MSPLNVDIPPQLGVESERKVSPFQKVMSAVLQDVLVSMSNCLSLDLQQGVVGEEFTLLFKQLREELSREGAVELHIAADGEIRIGAGHLSKSALGLALAGAGIREVMFLPDLVEEDLLQFLQIVSALAEKPVSPEADLVSFWYEMGPRSIRLVRTSLEATYLNSAGGNEKHISELFLHLVGRGEASRQQALKTKLAAFEGRPLSAIRALRYDDHSEIEQLINEMKQESEGSLRRQFTATLMAAMSVHDPVLGGQDFVFLLRRVVNDQMASGDWSDVLKTIRNLEFLVDGSTMRSAYTLEMAQACKARLRSAKTVIEVALEVHSQEDPSLVPFKLVRWFLGDDPRETWKQCAIIADEEALFALIQLFEVCFALEHPFWNDAFETLDPEVKRRSEAAMAAVKSAEKAEPSMAFEVPIDDMDPSDASSFDALDWLDFEADEEHVNELDASLVAFLDGSNSRFKVDKGPRKPGEGVPSLMLEHLEALEKSLMAAGKSSKGRNDT